MAKKVLCSSHSPTHDKDYASFYVDVYRINKFLPLPGLERISSELKERYQGEVGNPARIWIPDCVYSSSGKSWGLHAYYTGQYVDLEQHAHIFRLIKTYENNYVEAARKLHQGHPDISAELFTIILMANTLIELSWMQEEDAWQDSAAA